MRANYSAPEQWELMSLDAILTAGRLICDTYLTARELIRETSYSLEALAKSKLKQTRHNVNPADVPYVFLAPSVIAS